MQNQVSYEAKRVLDKLKGCLTISESNGLMVVASNVLEGRCFYFRGLNRITSGKKILKQNPDGKKFFLSEKGVPVLSLQYIGNKLVGIETPSNLITSWRLEWNESSPKQILCSKGRIFVNKTPDGAFETRFEKPRQAEKRCIKHLCR